MVVPDEEVWSGDKIGDALSIYKTGQIRRPGS